MMVVATIGPNPPMVRIPYRTVEPVAGRDQRFDVVLKACDLLIDGFSDPLEALGDTAGSGGGDSVGESGSIAHQLDPGRDQRMQPLAVGLARLPAGELVVPLLAVAGQCPGIDRIALAERAERADEGFDLAGIGSVGCSAGLDQGSEKGGLMAAGRFADHQAVRIERASELGQRFRIIGDIHGAARAAVERSNTMLADIAADKAGRGGGQIAHHGLSSSGLRLSAGVNERPWQLSKRQGKQTAGHDDGGR